MEKYDYIICGGGASGLLLSNAFIKDEFFNDKKILIIERESKTLNDKTFGFWNDNESVLDDMVFKEWDFAELSRNSMYLVKENFIRKCFQEDFMRLGGVAEDLMKNRFHPDNVRKFSDWGFDDLDV